MARWILLPLLLAVPSTAAAQELTSPTTKLQGCWEITQLIENGESVPVSLVKDQLIRDGRLYFVGSTIRFQRPGTFQNREIAFVLYPQQSPHAVDLAGNERFGSRGIYMNDKDTLLLCLCSPDSTTRPTGFGAAAGSSNVMMTFKRIRPESTSLSPVLLPPAPPPPQPEPTKNNDIDLRRMLVGTWGSQDTEKIDYFTLNSDGTFSSSRTWKGTAKKVFSAERRSSGTWKVEEGVLVARVTASTEADHNGIIYSLRIRWVAPTELLLVDQEGKLIREWKVPR